MPRRLGATLPLVAEGRSGSTSALATVWSLVGYPAAPVPWRERVVATVTSALGLALVVAVSGAVTDAKPPARLVLVGAMGAATVLLFAVPHGELSQPWPLIVGNLVSATIGVGVARTLGGGGFAAAAAVSVAIGAMHLLRAVHPPGGATALAAVLMVTPDSHPSWGFVIAPVMLNVGVILMAAVGLNAPFAWRRYPRSWSESSHSRQTEPPGTDDAVPQTLTEPEPPTIADSPGQP